MKIMKFRNPYMVVLALSLAVGSALAGPSGSNSPGSASWATGLVSVTGMGNGIYYDNSFIYNRFQVSGGECGGRQPEVRTQNSTIGIAQLQGIKATLLSAIATGAQVRLHWVGPYCWVDDVVVCSNPSDCLTY
jgi:hypothetical protein